MERGVIKNKNQAAVAAEVVISVSPKNKSIIIFDIVQIQEFEIFFFKVHRSMMLFLILNIFFIDSKAE